MASSPRISAVAFYLLCLAYACTAANYPLSSAGIKLLNVMSNLQYMNSPQLLLPIYGSSHAAALCERLGVYLLRPPTGPATNLDNKIAAWLPGGAAKSLGWKLIAGKQADAGKAGQKYANAGTIVLAVVEGKCYGGSSVIGTVVPEATDDASLASEGPRVIVGINRGKASRLLGSCFSKGGIKYYSYTRPSAAQLPNTYSGVWTDGLTEYLVEAAPGGGIQAATIYYADSNWLSYYKYADFGATSPSSSATPTWYTPRWPKKNPTQFGDTGGPTGPYTFKADGSATFKLSGGKITYTASKKTATLKRKAGSGTCAACGFWYSNDSKLAFAFYVESAGASGLTGRLLSAAYSKLNSKDSLIGQTKSSAIQYADGAYYPVPYWFTGAKSGAGYKGQLQLMYRNGAKTGSYSSPKGQTVVTITVDKASGDQVLTVNHQGNKATFFKGTAFQKGVLPKL